MSYNTWYELKHDAAGDPKKKAIEEYIEANEELRDAVGSNQSHVKWYEHDDDMLKLSKEFPEVTFILSGEGEESDDMWESKYKDGKMATRCPVIEWPEFGELKEKSADSNENIDTE
jgi:hypothetical protein